MTDQELASVLVGARGWRWFGTLGQLISPDAQRILWPSDAARAEGIDPDRDWEPSEA